jgi:hypothetical protein
VPRRRDGVGAGAAGTKLATGGAGPLQLRTVYGELLDEPGRDAGRFYGSRMAVQPNAGGAAAADRSGDTRVTARRDIAAHRG